MRSEAPFKYMLSAEYPRNVAELKEREFLSKTVLHSIRILFLTPRIKVRRKINLRMRERRVKSLG